MIISIKEAFLQDKLAQSVGIEFLPEDPCAGDGCYVGKLLKDMYGSRDAPVVRHEEVAKTMQTPGFEKSITKPCVYYHPGRDVWVVAHVDELPL